MIRLLLVFVFLASSAHATLTTAVAAWIAAHPGSPISVTSIARTSTTATVTTSTSHGYVTGEVVTVAGANETAYNGNQMVTVTGTTTFTYTVIGSPSQPATGTITAKRPAPFSVLTGDSTMAGYNVWLNDGPVFANPTGDINGSPAYRVYVNSGSAAVNAQNFAVSGYTTQQVSSIIFSGIVAKSPKYIINQTGANDLLTGGLVFADVATYYDSMLSACTSAGITFLVCEVMSVGQVADQTRVTAYNAGMAAWCVTNGVTQIKLRYWMADPSNQNAILPAWTWDNTHLTLAGDDRASLIYLGALSAKESTPYTYPAYDTTREAVAAGVAAAIDGDTITIPAGTSAWADFVEVDVAVTVQGAGIGQTILQDNVATFPIMFGSNLVAGKTTRFTGIEFQSGTRTGAGAGTIYIVGSNTNGSRVRIDNCKFDNNYGPAMFGQSAIGVMDHCTVLGRQSYNVLALLKCLTWDGGISGNGAYASVADFGSVNFMFFEYNTVTGTSTLQMTSGMDAQGGARFVVRHNTFVRCIIEAHGSETTLERSVHAVEIYANTFDLGNLQPYAIYFRGGTGVVYDNAISNSSGVGSQALELLDNRTTTSCFPPYGGADGRNPWDDNTGSPWSASNTVTSFSGSLTQTTNMTVTASASTFTDFTGYTIRKTSGKTVTSLTRVGQTVTVACTGHGFSDGDRVSIYGASQQAYYATNPVTVINANSFTYGLSDAFTPTDESPAVGVKATLGGYFAEVASSTSTSITYKPSLYSTQSENLVFTASDTFEINKIVQAMDQPGRLRGTLITSITPSPPVGWNDQITYPWYQWNNNLGGVTGVKFNPQTPIIVENEHFINDTARPGYTPFTDPYPGTGGSGGSVATVLGTTTVTGTLTLP